LEHVLGELLVAAHDLEFVLRRLAELQAEQQLAAWTSSIWDEIQFWAQSFLSSVYRIRTRAGRVTAALTNVEPSHFEGRGRAAKLRQALQLVSKRDPELAQALGELDRATDQTVRVRGLMAHETVVRLALLINGEIFEPGELLVELESMDEGRWRVGRQALSGALYAFVEECGAEQRRISRCAEIVLQRAGV
jgi:hypothetical protein